MRTSDRKLNPILKNQIVKTFAQLVVDISGEDEAHKFINDFFNKAELETFAKRLAVAYWLKKKRSYDNIKRNLKVSSSTIAAVQGTMEKPGFKLAIKKLEAEEWANVWSQKIRRFVKR